MARVNALAGLQPMMLALAVGLLVGLERGWSARAAEAGTRVAGFRTFGLLGLAGGLAALVPKPVGLVFLASGAALILLGYMRASEEPHSRSATGALAGLVTLGLGWFAASGHGTTALAVAAVMTLILAMRHRLHGALRGMSEAEMEAVGRFAILALVILPLVPDRAMGPLDAWNPRTLWFVVVLVSGISFLGYALTRRMGPGRGLMATAAAGALVSSTAVTADFARRMAAPGAPQGVLVAGISLASLVMFVRVLVLTGILAPAALASLALMLLPAIVVQGAWALRLLKANRPATSADDVKLGNPLDVRPALLLVALLAVLAVGSRYAIARFGGAGVGVLLTLTGLADVDAAIITLSTLPPGTLSPWAAGLVLALPVFANTLWKAGLCLVFAPHGAGWRAASPLVASVAAGGLMLLLAVARGGL